MAIIRRVNQKREVRYQVKVRDRIGRWFPSETFRTRAEAEAYERQLMTQRDQGDMALAPSQRDMTVQEYWQLWASECRGETSEGWKISQDQIARDYVFPYLGSRKLIEVRPQDVGWTLEQIRRTGLKPQTVRHIYSHLHKIFEDAVEHYGWLARNPVLGRYRPKVPLRERDFLTPAQSQKLLGYVEDHYLGAAIHLQIWAGLRNSEVQALRWRAVDFERGLILIRAAFNNKENRIQEHPKQNDWGMAPITPQLRAYLQKLQRQRGEGPDAFVAQSPKGEMLSYETYLRTLGRLCIEAGVPEVTPHELRHSCTEIYVQAGATAEDVRRLLNQSSLTATARYMHRTDERLHSIANRLGTLFGSPNPEPTPSSQPALRLVR